jgi:hypothetical protein
MLPGMGGFPGEAAPTPVGGQGMPNYPQYPAQYPGAGYPQQQHPGHARGGPGHSGGMDPSQSSHRPPMAPPDYIPPPPDPPPDLPQTE